MKIGNHGYHFWNENYCFGILKRKKMKEESWMQTDNYHPLKNTMTPTLESKKTLFQRR
jgi:hypothetical protein